MQLKTGTIYKVIVYQSSLCNPTLSLKGSVQVYASLSGKKPTSTSEMFLLNDLDANSINAITGLLRWVCAVYEDDGTNKAEECGLVTFPADMTE